MPTTQLSDGHSSYDPASRHRSRADRVKALVQVPWFLPCVVVSLVLLATSDRYGPDGDELYFRMLPLRWAYVDQPPLTVWLAHAAAVLSDAIWVQRLPAIASACAGVVVASLIPRAVGASLRTQQWAAWGHASSVYVLLMGHLMLTSSLDLLCGMLVALFVVRASHTEGPRWLVGASVIAGVGCWNKLLILVPVIAMVSGLGLSQPRLLLNRWGMVAGAVLTVVAGPQILHQVTHGLPMLYVNASMVADRGWWVRFVIVPATIVFMGPPWIPVWWRGLVHPWREDTLSQRRLLPAAALVAAWAFIFAAQPHYLAPMLLPALALGWVWRAGLYEPAVHRRRVMTVNMVVATVICLPWAPVSSPMFAVLGRTNPTLVHQVGWPEYVQQMGAVGGRSWVVT